MRESIRNVALVAAIAFAACGGDDGTECIPGDASRPDVICSEQGRWVPRQGECPLTLPPGAYRLRKEWASGDLACPVLDDELFVIESDGTVGADSAGSDDGCSDDAMVDGCRTIIERSCLGNGCSAAMLIVLDRGTGTGVMSAVGSCPSFEQSCTYDLRLESL